MPESTASPVDVVFALPSFAAGGAERVLITLMNGLDRTRFTPRLICLNRDGPLRTLVAPDIPIYAELNCNRVVHGLPYLFKTLRKLKPNIVVSTMAHMNFAVLLVAPFLPRQTKIIVREAITPSFLVDNHKQGKLIRRLYKWLYPRARKVICPAQCIIDEFESCVDMKTGNFSLLYNPVNINKIRAQPPGDKAASRIHFVCAGRLHHQKGFDRLIESLSSMQIDIDWHLTILGDGDERETLETLIKRYDLENHITLAGFSAAPWPHIAQADCFLLPSRHEGLPNVALESLCVGTPVIAMDSAGGISEIAALAAPGSVTLCRDMDEFINAMMAVTPLPHQPMLRDSLLPHTFHPETVEECFMALLDQAA